MPSADLDDQWDINDDRLHRDEDAQSTSKSSIRAKVKCDICNKFYRANYMKVSFYCLLTQLIIKIQLIQVKYRLVFDNIFSDAKNEF